MRTLVVAVATAVAAAVLAGSAVGSGGPVLVLTEVPCAVGDGDGGLHITFDSSFVIYSSGKAVLRCQATGLPNSSGAVVYFNFANTGQVCDLGPFGATTNWVNKVSKLGTSQLTCTGHVDLNGGPVVAAAAAAGFGRSG